ncbi:MAG TPA: PEPxxWA-CTERM sorting domain-containing protein [Sphingomicrobium sp.]|nr:PEPxxWA-CTERM sorting domain-containing protein [Sphingomicrobium sp.]
MRRVLIMALAGAAIAAATPAFAATVVSSPAPTSGQNCTAFTFSASYSECAGGFTGNLIQGTLQAPGPAAVTALGGASSTYLATQIFTSTGTSINFGTTLFGPTIIGLHYGAAGNPNSVGSEATSFFLFDFTTPTSSITVDSRTGTSPNFGLSNAALFSTGSVPEPATWAMMLMGFAGMGFAVRRTRRSSEGLMQVA